MEQEKAPTKRKRKRASEAEEIRVEMPAEPLMTFLGYLSENSVNKGLVASYRYEARNDKEPLEIQYKTAKEWQAALDAQSKRTY